MYNSTIHLHSTVLRRDIVVPVPGPAAIVIPYYNPVPRYYEHNEYAIHVARAGLYMNSYGTYVHVLILDLVGRCS